MIYHHPYLFSIGIKADIFRLVSLDLFSAMSFAHTYLFRNSQKLLHGRAFWPVTIRCDHLFEDGVKILKDFAPGAIQMDLLFEGENGFGHGPTREFFDLFAKYFSRKDLNLWMDSFENETEYAFTKIGLFPRPDADPEMFYVLGLLCGKALSMNVALPIPLSEQFFKFIGNEPLTIRDIDPNLADSLSEKNDMVTIGMTFTYPGIEKLELIPNGSKIDVTRDNYDLYVKQLTEFTCGEKLSEIKDQFLRGLFSVIEPGLWNCLTANEKRVLICGESSEVTMKDLEENIRFGYGYEGKQPQKQMLFEVILELDKERQSKLFKFITGCERLPIGGLSALQPRIIVARRISEDYQSPDETLPTAATCTNYFKLPAYSSKKIMKERLVLAITEGQEGFLLS